MTKLKKIEIENKIVSITQINDEDYICLTDMAKAKQGDNRAAYDSYLSTDNIR